MVNASFRNQVVDTLKPMLPRNWTWYSYRTNLDTFVNPVVVLTMQTIERHPDAPQGSLLVSCTLTVLEPKTTPGKSDDDLEDKVLDLTMAIDKAPAIHWERAERVIANNDRNPGYDISIQLAILKKDS